MVETTIYTILSTSPAVTALVSDRINPMVLDRDTGFPAISYLFISTVSSPTFSTRGSQRYRFEVSCWAQKALSAWELRAAVITALNGYSQDGVVIQFMLSRDMFDHISETCRATAEFYVFSNL
ncbi:DUF3168 domain-containing protein [Granulicella tundricola]|uniref:DUF3168 domain-containing protein n=1 Tax=Granulicella tundricola (strain ATCC BAA-1859 / DSM 23138 / MP5ACTX9) TaxID=1198114 RepID=E8X0R0_GRATM|nr:DUF3168 domain-containing protein [Granulicella tundricola]ADW69011.1 hypothetical protein AciX9_1965 [Granulicella tundricola MP5ACTX9]